MLSVHEISDFGEFEGLRDVWNQILWKSKDNDVFSTWEWLWCWWKHFGKERSLRLLIAREKDEIFGIAPLMLSKYSFLHVGKLTKIEFVGAPHSDYNSFILLKKPHECLKVFLDRLVELSDWDLLDLRDVREGSASAVALQSMCNSETLNLKLRVGTVCPYISLPNSVEAFTHVLSRNMRKNLRRRMRKLGEKYKVEVKTHQDFGSVEEAMKTFFELHQKRWISKGKSGAFTSRAFHDFHLELAKVFNNNGWLALHFLTANDKPVAAVYSFDYYGKKYGYLTGFDPDFGPYGVGNLLKLHVVEECIKKGFREYDLMRDLELYKAEWATGVRRNFVVRMLLKGLSAKMYDWAMQNSFSLFFVNKFGMHFGLQHD